MLWPLLDFPKYWLPLGAKWSIREMQIPLSKVMNDLAKRRKSDGLGFESWCRQNIVHHEWAIILLWKLYKKWVWVELCSNCPMWTMCSRCPPIFNKSCSYKDMVTTKVSLQKVFQSEKANIKVLPPTTKNWIHLKDHFSSKGIYFRLPSWRRLKFLARNHWKYFFLFCSTSVPLSETRWVRSNTKLCTVQSISSVLLMNLATSKFSLEKFELEAAGQEARTQITAPPPKKMK